MKKNFLHDTGLFLLAVIFSLGLMFAFIELPKLLDNFLQAVISTPQTDPVQDPYKIELFYEAYGIRLIGFLCLGTIILLIILGFSTRKTGLAWLGSIALFLPVFATFAHSMFYLAGLGIFNVILFPFLDISLTLADLGKVVLVPYWILIWFFRLFNLNAHSALVYSFMIIGALIFVLGVFSWLRARFSKQGIAVEWLYKYSRHPQYLGWIIWSYGLMLYGPSLNIMKKSWGWNGTLPWLISTLVIIGICMLEELKMQEKTGADYEAYRNKTPFLLPLPGFIRWIFNAPLRIFFRKERPERKREIGTVILFYALLLVGISAAMVVPAGKPGSVLPVTKQYSQARVDSLLYEILKPQSRRDRSMTPYNELLAMGSKTHPLLIQLIKNEQPEVREFAIGAASQNKITSAIPAIIEALHDSVDLNKRNAIRAFGNMHATIATDTLLYFLENNTPGYRQDVLLSSLASLGSTEVIPLLEKSLENAEWYQWSASIKSMMKLDRSRALRHTYEGLENKDPQIRRESVYIILEELPPGAIPYLEKVTGDSQWEVRFYARQAIRLIRECSERQI